MVFFLTSSTPSLMVIKKVDTLENHQNRGYGEFYAAYFINFTKQYALQDGSGPL